MSGERRSVEFILQTEWFAKNFITVIPAKAGIHTTHS